MPVSHIRSAVVLSSRRDIVKRCVPLLKRKKDLFDAIAFTGMSGALIAPIFCDMLKKDLIVVRKAQFSGYDEHGNPRPRPIQGEVRHTSLIVEYVLEVNPEECRYIIMDDFISSGRTVEEIWKNLKKSRFEKPVAVFCYSRTAGHNKFSFGEVPVWGPGDK